jgi:hypothetical protein
MELSTFLVHVFCLIDDWMQDQTVRTRGPRPRLHDSEVLTMEVVGAFLGIDTDEGVFDHFRRHYADWFPALESVHRTTFTRQAANLWHFKERLWRHVLTRVNADPEVSVIDSFPMPVCRFARAKRCRRLREHSAYGYDDMAKQTFYGLRVHLVIAWPGVIVDFRLAPGNISDVKVAKDLLAERAGWTLGDRNYWSPQLREECENHGLCLLSPYKTRKGEQERKARGEPACWSGWLTQKRRRVETVIGQLSERYRVKKVWARDGWHLWSRWLRTVLSHTIAVLFCQQQHLSPLDFDGLIID